MYLEGWLCNISHASHQKPTQTPPIPQTPTKDSVPEMENTPYLLWAKCLGI
jgi:hypothetical protein